MSNVQGFWVFVVLDLTSKNPIGPETYVCLRPLVLSLQGVGATNILRVNSALAFVVVDMKTQNPNTCLAHLPGELDVLVVGRHDVL